MAITGRKTKAAAAVATPQPKPGDIITWVRNSESGYYYKETENFPYVYLGKLVALGQELWVVKFLGTDKLQTITPAAEQYENGTWKIHESSQGIELELIV